ncbi:uncharacterized protein BCR38DRAFT_499638 [Pseudomassariella vexata]|uniref:Uncharacterized protein n=1 Tax=Pseudomassariella vexata TaxID=1141098 RepID=A0A1Y2DHT5_9PEZI|nr:uncharacterized protein BCR38DRAFT_499638 [Pseudomassariella vexata]ORY58813.1 hypothetical protein BCR38DRAFT_499638 [Pseudomassariella vexata]
MGCPPGIQSTFGFVVDGAFKRFDLLDQFITNEEDDMPTDPSDLEQVNQVTVSNFVRRMIRQNTGHLAFGIPNGQNPWGEGGIRFDMSVWVGREGSCSMLDLSKVEGAVVTRDAGFFLTPKNHYTESLGVHFIRQGARQMIRDDWEKQRKNKKAKPTRTRGGSKVSASKEKVSGKTVNVVTPETIFLGKCVQPSLNSLQPNPDVSTDPNQWRAGKARNVTMVPAAAGQNKRKRGETHSQYVTSTPADPKVIFPSSNTKASRMPPPVIKRQPASVPQPRADLKRKREALCDTDKPSRKRNKKEPPATSGTQIPVPPVERQSASLPDESPQPKADGKRRESSCDADEPSRMRNKTERPDTSGTPALWRLEDVFEVSLLTEDTELDVTNGTRGTGQTGTDSKL